jgi:hypothetical protein
MNMLNIDQDLQELVFGPRLKGTDLIFTSGCILLDANRFLLYY